MIMTMKLTESVLRPPANGSLPVVSGPPLSKAEGMVILRDASLLASSSSSPPDGEAATSAVAGQSQSMTVFHLVGLFDHVNRTATALLVADLSKANDWKAKMTSVELVESLWELYSDAVPGSQWDLSSCIFLARLHFQKQGVYQDPYLPSSVLDASQQDLYLVDGSLVSLGCVVGMGVSAETFILAEFLQKTAVYALLVCFVTLIQLFAAVRQMDHCSSPASAMRVSIVTLGQQTVIDSYICLFHLTSALVVTPLFTKFASCAFLQFLLFSVFEMRTLLSTWRAQRGSAIANNWNAFRWELGALYIRFYGFLFFGIFLMYQATQMFKTILFLLYCYWIPQIVHNVSSNAKKPLDPVYIATMSLSRLVLPGYYLLYEGNFLGISKDPNFWLALFALSCLQGGFLLLQHYKGARFFVPQRMLPARYDYFRAPVLEDETMHLLESGAGIGGSSADGAASGRDCVICMNAVTANDFSSRQAMTTPCNHVFHKECLERWIEVKLECPTCRAPLPEP